MNKKLIIVNGSSCSGKSSLCLNIKKNNSHLYVLSYDYLKQMISDYDGNRDASDIWKILIGIVENMFSDNLNVCIDGWIKKKSREVIIAKAKSEDYEVIEINLDTPFDVIKERFNERLINIKTNDEHKESNTSVEKLEKIYDRYNIEKYIDAISFDTSIMSSIEIYQEVQKILNKE